MDASAGVEKQIRPFLRDHRPGGQGREPPHRALNHAVRRGGEPLERCFAEPDESLAEDSGKPVRIQIDGAQLRRIMTGEHQHRERQGPEHQQFQDGDHVKGRVGHEVDRIREHAVEGIGVYPEKNANERSRPHGQPHVHRRLPCPDARIVAEKNEIRDLDAGVVKHTGGGEHQHQPDDGQVLLGGGGDRHRFADEAAEQGKGGNGGGADHAAHGREGHGFVKPPEVGGPDLPGHVEHRSGGHEQQRLVDDVAEGMGDHPVDGQRRADPDAADHETHLVDQAVGQHPPHVVDDDRVKNRKAGHERPGPDQQLGTRERSGPGYRRRSWWSGRS